MSRSLLIVFLAGCAQPLPELAQSTAAGCGNGRVESGEACDDGNINDRDACTNACALASCGDQILRTDLAAGTEGHELCDDGDLDDLFCTRFCQPPRCGDGIVLEGREDCDDGNLLNTDACLNSCALGRCGDGFLQEGVETCDDGNELGGDGCSPDCSLEGCGNGQVEPGESCDDGNQEDVDACTSACQVAICGDGILRTDLAEDHPQAEACDDGNLFPEDDCSPDCQLDDHGDHLSTATAAPDADALHIGQLWGTLGPGDQDVFFHVAVDEGGHHVTATFDSTQPVLCRSYNGDNLLNAETLAQPIDVDGEIVGRSCDMITYLNIGERGIWAVFNPNEDTVAYHLKFKSPCGNGEVDPREECDPFATGHSTATCRADCRRRNTMTMTDHYACAMRGDAVTCWGSNVGRIMAAELPADNRRDCGDPAQSSTIRPATIQSNLPLNTHLRSSGRRTCWVQPDGTTACWGQLKDWENVDEWLPCGDANAEELAQDYPSGRDCVSQPSMIDLPDPADGQVDTIALSNDNINSYECLLQNHRVLCRGINWFGSLGLGPDSIVLRQTDWRPVTGISSWADYLDVGNAHACIIERFISTSVVSCWGRNNAGQIGVPRVINPGCDGDYCEPASVILGEATRDTIALSVGFLHNCSVNLQGQVLCWGHNSWGQTGQPRESEVCDLGDGVSTTCTTRPTVVEGLPAMIDVQTGGSHTCALSQTGEVWCWGSSYFGALGHAARLDGDNQPGYSSQPFQVGSLPTVTHIASGGHSNCALTIDDDLFCWGSNLFGQVASGRCNTITANPVLTTF